MQKQMRYRMYKDGKHWVTASATVALGMLAVTPLEEVQADAINQLQQEQLSEVDTPTPAPSEPRKVITLAKMPDVIKPQAQHDHTEPGEQQVDRVPEPQAVEAPVVPVEETKSKPVDHFEHRLEIMGLAEPERVEVVSDYVVARDHEARKQFVPSLLVQLDPTQFIQKPTAEDAADLSLPPIAEEVTVETTQPLPPAEDAVFKPMAPYVWPSLWAQSTTPTAYQQAPAPPVLAQDPTRQDYSPTTPEISQLLTGPPGSLSAPWSTSQLNPWSLTHLNHQDGGRGQPFNQAPAVLDGSLKKRPYHGLDHDIYQSITISSIMFGVGIGGMLISEVIQRHKDVDDDLHH